MPIYTYQIVNEDGTDGDTFEVIRGMHDPPLTMHPETGQPVKRVFTAPHIAGWANSRQAREMLSDSNLDKHGFTKYVRSGKGNYEKHTGKGPETLNVND
jgi:hypothetical protein